LNLLREQLGGKRFLNPKRAAKRQMLASIPRRQQKNEKSFASLWKLQKG
jgi:hypothetical protein